MEAPAPVASKVSWCSSSAISKTRVSGGDLSPWRKGALTECINLELKSKRVGEVRFLKLEEARGVTPIQERPIFDLFRKQGIGVSAFWKCGEWDHSHYTCWA